MTNKGKDEKVRVKVKGMHCASCAVNIENALKEKGFNAVVNYNLSLLETDGNLDKVREIVRGLGYDIEQPSDMGSVEHEKDHMNHEHDHGKPNPSQWKLPMVLSIVFSVPLIILMLADILYPEWSGSSISPFVQMLLAIAIIVSTKNIHIPGFKSLIKMRPNMDSLIFMSVFVSFIYSTANLVFGFSDVYFFDVAGIVPAFITIGKYLEEKTKEKTGSAIRSLLKLKPKKATKIVDGKQVEADAEDLKEGDVVLVKAGEMFPSDGIVVEGETWANESMMTGESEPVRKERGDEVIGGTINEGNPVKVRITRPVAKSILSRIIKSVEDAQMRKTSIQKLADKISSVFVPVVIAIATLTFVFWTFSAGISKAVFFTASVLAVACPCALGLATPTAIMAGSGIAARKGILIRNPDVLEKSGRIDYLLIDKTGTLTMGEMEVSGYSSEEILGYAAAAELHSEHPIGKAIIKKAKELGMDIKQGTKYKVIKGMGIHTVIDGKEIYVGNRKLMEDAGIIVENDKIWVLVREKGKADIIGWIEVEDRLKDNAREVVQELKAMVREVVMVTGDSEEKARKVASELGINYRANVLPDEKMKIVEEYQKKGEVAFVGDGINDSPALSRADVGIAFPSTEIATESGDIVLMRDSLELIPESIKLSRYLMKKIRQNFAWAFIYNILAIPVAAGLFSWAGIVISPEMSAAMMSLSSISVVLNSLSMQWLYR